MRVGGYSTHLGYVTDASGDDELLSFRPEARDIFLIDCSNSCDLARYSYF